ncbi:MAG: BACON domain-containing protein, partial [Nitrospirae bacterium]|nr:BACON domain-containing protein [Nitrospirota bacterium]
MKKWIFLCIFIMLPSFVFAASSNWDSLVWDSDVWDGGGSTGSYTLSVTKSGTGTGTITSSPAGISCGSTCSSSYTSGTSVTLTAAPDSGSSLSSWSGCDSSSGNTCTVAMTAAKSVTAAFAPGSSCASTYTLDSTSANYTYSGGSGSVGVTSSNPLCSWSAAANVSWIIITSPASVTGSNTVLYSVAANTGSTSRTGTISIAGQTFTVNQDSLNNFTLTVTKTGSGSGTVTASTGAITWSGNSGTGSYTSWAAVYLTATAGSGSTFAGWTGCDTTSSALCYVAMSSAKLVTATFSSNNSSARTLTIVKSGTGSGTVTASSGTITWSGNTGVITNAVSQITLTAVPGSGSTFNAWTGCDSLINTMCGLTMSTDKTVTIDFKGGKKLRQSKFDLDGDGNTDILWRNKVYGYNVAWLMNGTTVKDAKYLDTVNDPSWTIAGAGHFNQDNQTGILWRNQMTGAAAIWYYTGTVTSGGAALGTISDINWEIVSAGDTDSDNNTEVIWRNNTNGYNAKWKIKKSTATSMVLLPTFSDSNWAIAGTGDFYGDGTVAILWRHKLYGYNALWHMSGDSVSSTE